MVVVAVAGTGLVGSQIIRALLNTGKHTVVVLSRSAKPELSAQGALVKSVDYTSVPSIASALSLPEPVHTVISCIVSPQPTTTAEPELNLLAAAQQVGVKRFAPCEFSLYLATSESVDFFRRVKVPVWRAAEESGMEVTAFCCGVFMNYFAYGSDHPNAKEDGMAGVQNFPFIVDIKAGKAQIPGTGQELVTFTRIQDVALFVAAAVELDKWEKETSMAGDRATYDEVVRIAEEVTGRKFEVVKHSTEDLRKEADSKGPAEKFFIEAALSLGLGEGNIEPRLNKVVAVEPMGVKEFITKFWGKQN